MNELIKREDAIKATWQEPSYTDPYNILTEVRDRIKALPTASPWHRVEEKPKPFEMVIAYVDPWHIFAAYHNGHGDWKENDGFNVIGVRYWMPIEPPKEDADGE
jgi:hypothetical protein